MLFANTIVVQPGEIVSAGQKIAEVGSNGNSTGPHLQFTVATGFNSAGYPVTLDPEQYVRP